MKKNYSILLENSFREKFIEKAIRKFGTQEKFAEYLNSRVKSRHIRREDIKNWKKGEHHFGWNLFIPIDIVKELCLTNKNSLEYVLKKATKFNPTWADPKRKKLLVKEKKIKIIKKNGKEYLDIYTGLPKEALPATRSKKKLPLFAEKDNHSVRLWSEACWKLSEIRLKRFVKLDELFFEGAAIYSSEGLTKSDNYNDRVLLGNSEPAIINLFLQWLNSFLEGCELSFFVSYNGQNCDEKTVRDFWVRKIPELKENCQLKIRKRVNYNSGLINNFGVLNIKISNTVLKSFVLNLLNIAKKLALSKKEYSLMYLRGLLASEGSVAYPTLREVTIGCLDKNKEERNFIRKLLKIMEFKFSEGKNQLAITSWDSFYILYEQDAFKIKQINSYSKKDRFITGLKRHRRTQKFLKLQKFEKDNFTAREWQETYKLKRYISAHKFLGSLIKENILASYFKKNIKYYYINLKMKPFLESIWRLKSYNCLTI